ncbi:hypothetical protein K3495_g3716 [Podosphaera aphanis]|nr:hypothetical protein K3495_g3716 [Podosphaera aphanis]
MPATQLLRRYFAPGATGAVVAGLALLPKTSLHAESPQSYKKPIYDDDDDEEEERESISSPTPTALSQDKQSSLTKPRSPTPTDRLAEKIGKTRLFLHGHVSAVERKVNEVMGSAFQLEESFTSTIASLAPSPQSGERLMPGSLYVIVAAMAGSIVSRNRNIVLRALLPGTIAISAGWILLPVTMRNVSDLVWKYEQRFPVIANNHIRSREAIEKSWMMARMHSELAVNTVNDRVSAGRSAVENWVRKES